MCSLFSIEFSLESHFDLHFLKNNQDPRPSASKLFVDPLKVLPLVFRDDDDTKNSRLALVHFQDCETMHIH